MPVWRELFTVAITGLWQNGHLVYHRWNQRSISIDWTVDLGPPPEANWSWCTAYLVRGSTLQPLNNRHTSPAPWLLHMVNRSLRHTSTLLSSSSYLCLSRWFDSPELSLSNSFAPLAVHPISPPPRLNKAYSKGGCKVTSKGNRFLFEQWPQWFSFDSRQTVLTLSFISWSTSSRGLAWWPPISDRPPEVVCLDLGVLCYIHRSPPVSQTPTANIHRSNFVGPASPCSVSHNHEITKPTSLLYGYRPTELHDSNSTAPLRIALLNLLQIRHF